MIAQAKAALNISPNRLTPVTVNKGYLVTKSNPQELQN